MARELLRVQEKFRHEPRVRLASVVLTPGPAPAATLAQLAEQYGTIAGKWMFLTGPADTLQQLGAARAWPRRAAATGLPGRRGPGQPAGRQRCCSVDRDRRVRGVYDGTDSRGNRPLAHRNHRATLRLCTPPLNNRTRPCCRPATTRATKSFWAALGVVVPLLVAVLYLLPRNLPHSGAQVKFLPAVNAVLNSLTAVCLLAGFYFIRQKTCWRHRADDGHGLRAGGPVSCCRTWLTIRRWPARILAGRARCATRISSCCSRHISLAVVTVGLVLFTLYFALTGQYTKHKAIAAMDVSGVALRVGNGRGGVL
ncbi:MAG: DUF420 domain-containing protein [Hymenobacter sp.]